MLVLVDNGATGVVPVRGLVAVPGATTEEQATARFTVPAGLDAYFIAGTVEANVSAELLALGPGRITFDVDSAPFGQDSFAEVEGASEAIEEAASASALERWEAHVGTTLGVFVVDLGQPDVADDDCYLADTALGANLITPTSEDPPNDKARTVKLTRTTQGGTPDTLTSVTVRGPSIVPGRTVEEDLVVPAGGSVESTRAFKGTVQFVPNGWAQGGTDPDLLRAGTGDGLGAPVRVGPPEECMVLFDGAIVHPAPVTQDEDEVEKNLVSVAGLAPNGVKRLTLYARRK